MRQGDGGIGEIGEIAWGKMKLGKANDDRGEVKKVCIWCQKFRLSGLRIGSDRICIASHRGRLGAGWDI